MTSTVNLIASGGEGHQEEFEAVFSAVLADHGARLTRNAGEAVADFFPTLDQDLAGFVARSISNALGSRRTVGIFFRPRQCFLRTRIKYLVKDILFRTLKRLPNVAIVSIIPFELEPRAADYANGSMHCPMSWDLPYLPALSVPPDEGFANAIRAKADGRRILVTLGRQETEKAFGHFANIWRSDPEVRRQFLFVSAGRIAPQFAGQAERFEAEGGCLIDRYLSPGELLQLYLVGDLVWSCYVPDYDQASGIFGRALQLGCPAVVREGSYLSRLGLSLEHPTLGIPFHDPIAAARRLTAWNPARPDQREVEEKISRIRRSSIEVLIAALGLETRP